MGLNELAMELVNGCVGTLGDFEVKKVGGGGGNRLLIDKGFKFKVLEGGVIRVIVELKVGLFISRNVIGEEDDDDEEEDDEYEVNGIVCCSLPPLSSESISLAPLTLIFVFKLCV